MWQIPGRDQTTALGWPWSGLLDYDHCCELVLGILDSIIVMMIAALQRLQQSVKQPHLPDQLVAFGISGGIGQGMKRLFMSHPPLEERIVTLPRSM